MCRLYSVCVESTACGYIETMSITTLTIQLYTVGVAYYIVTFKCTVSVVRCAAVRLASLRLSCIPSTVATAILVSAQFESGCLNNRSVPPLVSF